MLDSAIVALCLSVCSSQGSAQPITVVNKAARVYVPIIGGVVWTFYCVLCKNGWTDRRQSLKPTPIHAKCTSNCFSKFRFSLAVQVLNVLRCSVALLLLLILLTAVILSLPVHCKSSGMLLYAVNCCVTCCINIYLCPLAAIPEIEKSCVFVSVLFYLHNWPLTYH